MAELGRCASFLLPLLALITRYASTKSLKKRGQKSNPRLMPGYDDAEKLLYFSDCGREDTQLISYDDLRFAMDCSYPGLSKPNMVWLIRMRTSNGKYEIFSRAVPVIGQIKENIVDYLTGKNDETKQFPMLFSQIADIMKVGFETLPM